MNDFELGFIHAVVLSTSIFSVATIVIFTINFIRGAK
jgi:hypothetical protein